MGLLLVPLVLMTGTEAPTAKCQDAKSVDTDSNLQQRLDGLISELGAQSFAKREGATTALITMGEPAVPTLNAALKHSSNEVRERAARILSKIEDSVFRRLSDEFLRDPDLSNSHSLPGWQAFLHLVGPVRSGKPLLLAMAKKQRDLARALDGLLTLKDPQELTQTKLLVKTETEKLVKRILFSFENYVEIPDLADSLALLCAVALLPEDVPAEAHMLMPQLPSQVRVLMQPGNDVCVRKIYEHWIPNAPPYVGPSIVLLATRYNIPGGIQAARTILSGKSQPEVIELSLKCVELFGEVRDIALVEKYLDDSTELTRTIIGELPDDAYDRTIPPGGLKPILPPGQVKIGITRMSDLVLAVCMSLEKQNLTTAFPNFRRVTTNAIRQTPMIESKSLAFPETDPRPRKEAMQAWKSSRKSVTK